MTSEYSCGPVKVQNMGMTSAELIAAATLIGAQLRAEQDESERAGPPFRGYPLNRLLEGGFYRILQPLMFGGGGADW